MNEAPPTALKDLPFTLSIGPQRSATSWIDRYLRKRGDVCLPAEVKEIFFFDRHFDRGKDFYFSHFNPSAAHHCAMEISTTSFDDPDAPKRVKGLLGSNTRLVCPLRHPVIRSYSLYLHYLRYGLTFPGLKTACEANPQILSSSHYAKHLQNWMETFPDTKIQFLYQEELEQNQEQFVRSLCTALNIPHKPVETEISNRYNATTFSRSGLIAGTAQKTADWLRKNRLYGIINAAKSIGLKRVIFGKESPDASGQTIPPHEKEWLEEQLLPEIQKLESLIGPIPHWQGL